METCCETCRWCGEKLVNINGVYCDDTLVFPQYCRNVEDDKGNVIEYGKLHEPINDEIVKTSTINK